MPFGDIPIPNGGDGDNVNSGCVLWLDSRYFTESYWWDISKYRNNGVVHGAKWKADAFYFNGSNTYVNCGKHSSLNITDEITIEAIVKPTLTDTKFRPVVCKYKSSGNQRSWWLGHYSGNWRFYVSNDGTNTSYVSATLELDKIHHLIAKFKPASGDDIFLYVNNSLKDSDSTGYSHLYSNNEDVLVGEYNLGNGYNFKGDIFLIRLFSKGLSSDQISILYNSGYKYI